MFSYNSTNVYEDLEIENISFLNTTIQTVSSVYNPKNNSLVFCDRLDENKYERLLEVKDSIILLNSLDIDFSFANNCVVFVKRPRKAYAILLSKIIKEVEKSKAKTFRVDNGSYINDSAIIGIGTVIEPFVYIDENVKIGKYCEIKSGARLLKNTSIGDNCIIKENAVIGSDGFGVERDVDGSTYKIPHVGGVLIGNNVEVGALTAIAQGTIEPTTIGDHTKIDDMVFIAHNANIGKGCLIIANSEISGSVQMGNNCWIAPNACIRDGLKIGNDVVVGMGTVVLKNVEDGSIVVGNPGKVMEKKK